MLEVFEKTRSFKLQLWITCDKFRFVIKDDNLDSSLLKLFMIEYTLNGKCIYICCKLESLDFLDFCFYLDRQVPSIVELKDKFRLFFIAEDYEIQRKIATKARKKLYRNPTISIKF